MEGKQSPWASIRTFWRRLVAVYQRPGNNSTATARRLIRTALEYAKEADGLDVTWQEEDGYMATEEQRSLHDKLAAISRHESERPNHSGEGPP